MTSKKITKIIESFIKEKTKGFNGVVIGISGGIDSTVVAYLAVNALGKDKVHGLMMPYEKNSNTEDGIKIAKILGIRCWYFDIKPMVKSFEEETGFFGDNISKGNLMARIRMSLLYGVANKNNMLVLGTSNKSEILTGYFTKFGDGGVDLEPIGDLYKTDVWKLAKYLGIDEKIINKTPSAELWKGQTDEKELGMNYPTLDKVLKGIRVNKNAMERVQVLTDRARHKSIMPPVARIGI